MNYSWNFGIFLERTPDGAATYAGWLISGLGWTVAVALCGWLLALLLGLPLGVMRTLPHRWARNLAVGYVELFRNVPLLAQLFIGYYVVPELLPTAWGNAVKQMHPTLNQFLTAFICLGLFTAARVCEQARAGIEALPPGQKSAALALGLSLPQTYRRVLLPLALRIVIPPLTSEFLNIFKNSAVALTIGLLELTAQSRQISEYTAQTFEAFIAATLLYLVVTFTVMAAMGRVERRSRIPGYLGGRGE